MTIAASNIVKIEPRVIGAGRSELELNGLLITPVDLTTEQLAFPSGLMEFTSAAAVGEVFGTTSPTYMFATQYFNGYVNKFSSPKALFVAAWAKAAQAGYVLSASSLSTLAQLKAITAGKMNFTVDGTKKTVTGINLASATSMAQVCTLVAADAEGWTLTYNGASQRFMLKSEATGAESSVVMDEQADDDTNLAYALGLMPSQGALTSAGVAAESASDVIARVLEHSQNWVTFTFSEPSDTADGESTIGETASNWAAQNYGFVYVGYSDNEALATTESDTDIISKMAVNDNTAFVYGDTKYAAFLMGSIASVDWNRENGAITYAFKSGVGLAATVTTEVMANFLENRNANFYGNYATRNAEFDFFYPGRLLNSNYVFIDPLINSIWLNNALQIAIMNGLTVAPRVPYTDGGYARIRSWMMDPINRARTNGTIEAGVNLSDAQKAEVMAEAGMDISEELFTAGYFLQIIDPGAQARVNRETPVISLWYTYGGAVQRITVASTAIL